MLVIVVTMMMAVENHEDNGEDDSVDGDDNGVQHDIEE